MTLEFASCPSKIGKTLFCFLFCLFKVSVARARSTVPTCCDIYLFVVNNCERLVLEEVLRCGDVSLQMQTGAPSLTNVSLRLDFSPGLSMNVATTTTTTTEPRNRRANECSVSRKWSNFPPRLSKESCLCQCNYNPKSNYFAKIQNIKHTSQSGHFEDRILTYAEWRGTSQQTQTCTQGETGAWTWLSLDVVPRALSQKKHPFVIS